MKAVNLILFSTRTYVMIVKTTCALLILMYLGDITCQTSAVCFWIAVDSPPLCPNKEAFFAIFIHDQKLIVVFAEHGLVDFF